MHVFADPRTPRRCGCSTSMPGSRPTAGENCSSRSPTPHGDNHDLWIDPHDPRRMIEGNDGGACVTFNGGATWSTHLQPADRAALSRDHRRPVPVPRLRRAAGQHDISVYPAARPRRRSRPQDWYSVGGGESGYIAVRPGRSEHRLSPAAPAAHLTRYDHRTRPGRATSTSGPTTPTGGATGDLKYRFQWTFPIVLSPHDPQRAVRHRRSTSSARRDEGQSWETHQSGPDPRRPEHARPVRRSAHHGQRQRRVLRDDLRFRRVAGRGRRALGRLRRRAGPRLARRRRPWTNVTPPDLPEWTHDQHHRAFAARPGDRVRRGDALQAGRLRAVSYKTADYGETWTTIDGGIPADDFTRVIREDPERPRTAVRRHRDWRVRVLRRRRRLAALAAQPAGRADPRPGRQTTAIWSSPRTAARSGSWTTSLRCTRALAMSRRICSSRGRPSVSARFRVSVCRSPKARMRG